MDFIGTKAIYIAVAIFITLSITTAILVTFNQVTDIYQKVYNTDVGIKKEFNEFTMYQNTQMSGLELYNTVRKFKDDNNILIYRNGSVLDKQGYISGFNLNDSLYSSKKYLVDYVDNGDNTYSILFVNK